MHRGRTRNSALRGVQGTRKTKMAADGPDTGARTPAARRQRVRRARKRDGVEVKLVETSREVRQALVDRGWAANDSDMADAISDLLDCWADGRLTTEPIAPTVTRDAGALPAMAHPTHSD